MAFVMGAVGARMGAVAGKLKTSVQSIRSPSRSNLQLSRSVVTSDKPAEKKFNNLPKQRWMKDLYDSYWFQILVVVLILGNFVVNIINAQYLITAHENDSSLDDLRDILKVFEVGFVVAFTVELLINLYGNFLREYLFGPDWAWNIFDAVVVIMSLVSLVTDSVPGVSALRTFRAFRILRLFKRVESLKLIIEGVLASLPGVSYAFVVLMLLVCVWAIMGVDFFKDELSSGFDGKEFFGDFPKAVFTMIQCLTTDNWIDNLSRPLALEPHGLALAPFFFVSFVFVTVFVMSNVIVAILLQEYLTKCQEMQATKEKGGGVQKVDRSHKRYITDYGQSLPNQEWAYQKYQSDNVQLFVAGLIFSNFMVNTASAWVVPEEGHWEDDIFKGFDVAFAALFGIELFANMYGSWYQEFWFGALRYWNTFDFVTVCASIVAISVGNISGVGMLRLLRAARVFRLFKRIPELRRLIEAIMITGPAVMQTFMILIILMSIWAIMGVEYFGAHRPDQFGTFGLSLLTMWQVLTVDSWSSIARDIIFADDLPGSAVFFVSFIFLNAIVMSNVVIAVLLEGYLKASHDLAMEAKEEATRKHRVQMTQEAKDEEEAKRSALMKKEVQHRNEVILQAIADTLGSDKAKNLLSRTDLTDIMQVMNKHVGLKLELSNKVEEAFGANSSQLMSVLMSGDSKEDLFAPTNTEVIMHRISESNYNAEDIQNIQDAASTVGPQADLEGPLHNHSSSSSSNNNHHFDGSNSNDKSSAAHGQL